jgi:ankyrin repeat protein
MLDRGADINARGSTDWFPVDQAILGGNLAAADKLLEIGVGFGHDALEKALGYYTKEYLAKNLLDRGADPNAEHKTYGNILQFTIQWSSEEAVGWLLDAGADVNAVEGEYGTALQAACAKGETGKVRLLLQHGPLVNAPACGSYGSALQAAAAVENEEILQLLLDHGAKVNARGGRYETALQAAAGTRKEKGILVRMLLEREADVNIVGGEYGTALRAALAQGHEDIARLLLEYRADPFVQVHGRHTSASAKNIGGGAPSKKNDIRLGDVVVSMPDGQHGGVVQYDLVKNTEDGFIMKGFLWPPPETLRSAVGIMRSDHWVSRNKIPEFLSAMFQKSDDLRISYQRPPAESDELFESGYRHVLCGESGRNP